MLNNNLPFVWHQPRNLLDLTGSYNTGRNDKSIRLNIYINLYPIIIIEKFAVSHYIKNITKAQFTEECVTWCYVIVCSFCILMDDLPYLTNHFENKNWDTFYSNSSINDVKNVFLYAFCKNDLEMWHKWFLNTRQGSNRVPPI